MKKIATSMFILVCAMTAASQEVYSTWAQHKYVVLDTRASALNVPGAALDIPVLVRLDSANFNAGFAQSVGRGADIRFTKNGDAVRLRHQIDRWDSAAKRAEIWVRADSVRGANFTSFRMHWGRAGAADSSRGSAVFDTANGFQAVLHLGEATDSLARDATVNALHATPANVGGSNPLDTAGVIGRAKSLRRTSATAAGFYTLNNTASGKLNFPAGGPFTLSAWANAYTNNSSHIISKDERQYSLGRRGSGAQWEIKELNEGEGKNYVQTTGTQANNAWTHVVGVRNGTAIALYLNGVLYSETGAVDASVTGRVTTGNVEIGRCNDNGAVATGTTASTCNYFPGAVDEVVLSNRARSASWVKLSYETQKPGARALLTDTMPIPLALAGSAANAASRLGIRAIGGGIAFRLPDGAPAGRLSVSDARGRAVWGKNTGAGERGLFWNGHTTSGRLASTGIYVVRFVPAAGTALETKVMLTR